MIRKISPLLLFLSIGLSLYFFNADPQENYPVKPNQKSSIASKDNPYGRIDWEINRLKSPITNNIPIGIREKELNFSKSIPTVEEIRQDQKSKNEFELQAEVSWTAIGPYNVGGRTRALAYDLDDENIIMAGGVSGGIWRTTDGGANWTKITTASSFHSVTCIAQDPRAGHRDTWYYGTGEYLGNSAGGGGGASYRGDGIYKSTDNGLTWSVLSATSTGVPQSFDNFFDYVWNLAVDPTNGYLYAATYGAIFRSINGGTSFSAVLGGSSPFATITDIAITSTGIFYATLNSEASTDGVFRSTDGSSWTNISSGVSGFSTSSSRIVLDIASSNENIVYFLIYGGGSGSGSCDLFKYTYSSGDGSGAGGTWVERSSNLPAEGSLTGDFDTQGGYDLLIKVKPDDPDFVIIGGTVLYKSTDGFATTGNTTRIGGYATKDTYSSYTNHHADQHSLFFFNSDKKIVYSGHDGGLSKTTDITASTVAWTSMNNGYLTSQFYNVALNRGVSADDVIIGGLQDNGTYSNGGNTSVTHVWDRVGSGDGAFCAVLDDHTHIVSSQNGTMYHQNANETNWTKITPTDASGYMFINPFAINPNDTKMLFLAAGAYLWRNSDVTGIARFSNSTTSTNWTQLTTTNTGDASAKQISAVSVSTTNSTNVVYYGTEAGEVYRVDNAHTGATPSVTDIYTGKGFPSGYVSCIAVDPTNSSNVMVVFSNYQVKSIFYSSDAGINWSDVSGNLEQNADGSGNGPSVRWAVIAPGSGSNYFVGTSTGLYSTTTLNGTSTVWAQDGSSTIGNVVVDCIDYRRSDGRIIVGTHANGIYKGTINAPLPVEINYFTAENVENNVKLAWETDTEINNYGFEIERKAEAGEWSNIGFVPGSGNSNSPKYYEFIDENPLMGSSEYRLKQIDLDGQYEFFSQTAKITISITGIEENLTPVEFALKQNYPNPFNPSTKINFSIPENGNVALKIYSTLGEEIAVLVNENMPKGSYEFEFNASSNHTQLSSGIYLYKLSLNNKKFITRKMILLK